ncbi:MAG: H+-translocating transhydrogenase subunit alpha [Actinomycetota bacterium]|jgi:NAD(P) transhydrogenase subunit alpha|nr:H+-translocating transhydrogenase subunit alpha [Actinomycetota bacterium]
MDSDRPSLVVGVLREDALGERRVALTPEVVSRVLALGLAVLVERGAGERAHYSDDEYVAAGATPAGRDELIARADLLIGVRAPSRPTMDGLRPRQTLIGMLRPDVDLELATRLADTKVTTVSFEGLPRTLSRAQSMDALTSQANVAGYKAVLVAADAYGGFFPMLMTAAGTTRPAAVLVLGAGVAGLQAIATAKRLGARITGYDVRAEAQGDVLSLGAAFLDLGGVSVVSEGGYARPLTAEESAAQQEALVDAISGFDVVITTAQVPGRRPPVLVPREALDRLKPGSVIVDIAASSLGGNVDGSIPDMTIVTERGVTIVGAGNLPSQVPRASSTAYARNVTALLALLVRDGALHVDLQDEVLQGLVVTHDGIVNRPETLGGSR